MKKPSRKLPEPVTPETWERFGLPRPIAEARLCEGRRWRADFLWSSTSRNWPSVVAEIHGAIWAGGAHSGGVKQANDFAKGHQCSRNGWLRVEFTHAQVSSGYAAAVVRCVLAGDRDSELPPDPEDRRQSAKQARKAAKLGISLPARRGKGRKSKIDGIAADTLPIEWGMLR